MRRALATAVVSALAAAGLQAAAEPRGFVDPTRPPSVSPEGGGASPAETRLQSVLISPRRRVALIDGQAVTVGEKIGDATVVRITEGAVVLKEGGELHTLKLVPDVEKVPLKPGAPGRSGGKEGGK